MSGSTRPQSPQLAEPLWTDPGLKSAISVRELSSSLKKKKAQVRNEWPNMLPVSSQARKKLPPEPKNEQTNERTNQPTNQPTTQPTNQRFLRAAATTLSFGTAGRNCGGTVHEAKGPIYQLDVKELSRLSLRHYRSFLQSTASLHSNPYSAIATDTI